MSVLSPFFERFSPEFTYLAHIDVAFVTKILMFLESHAYSRLEFFFDLVVRSLDAIVCLKKKQAI